MGLVILLRLTSLVVADALFLMRLVLAIHSWGFPLLDTAPVASSGTLLLDVGRDLVEHDITHRGWSEEVTAHLGWGEDADTHRGRGASLTGPL